MDRPFRLRRSIISVPGNREKMVERSAAISADMIMFDLEDSVPVDQKETARKMVVDFLFRNKTWASYGRSVRINPMDSPYAYRDIIEIVEKVGGFVDTVVIPKVNHPCEVRAVDYIVGQVERAVCLPLGRIGIEASIETAEGMLRVEEIAFSSSRLESLVFGIADYAASVSALTRGISGHGEAEDFYPGHRWHFPLSRLVMAAKAAGLSAIDAPYGNYKDQEGLKKSCLLSASLGCDGKWAIHPDQLSIINEIFSPCEEDIERSLKVVEAYEQCKKECRGATSLDGKMIDGASYRLAKRIQAYNELIQKKSSCNQ